jgi:hypothetical protein
MRSRDGLAGILLCLLVPEGAIGLGGTADAGPNSRTSAPLGPECYLSAPVDGNPDAAAAAFRDLGSILLYAGTLLTHEKLPVANIICDGHAVEAGVVENEHHTKGQSFDKYLREDENLIIVEMRDSQVFHVPMLGGKFWWVRICASDADHSTEWRQAGVPVTVPTHVVRIDCKLRDDERIEFQMQDGAQISCLFEVQKTGRTLAVLVLGKNRFCDFANPTETARRVSSVAASLGLLQ